MLTATLGGLIKDYRLKKRLSQLEVSLKIGWKDTSRLSKIEQGRVGKPTRETIEKIIQALDLDDQEKGEFLLVGGYLPTDEEIEKVIKEVEERIDTWQYPAYLIDFSWRCFLMNKETAKVFGFPQELVSQASRIKPNLLEFVIAPRELMPAKIWKGDDEENLKPFGIAQVAQFKVEQLGRESDGWYKKLIAKLIENNQFRKLWMEVKPGFYHKKLLDYEYKVVKLSGKQLKTFKFHIFTSRLISDQRFQIVLYLPVHE